MPSVTEVSRKNDPYLVLIFCVLSLRTKDKTTIEASRRLFGIAEGPQKMSEMPLGKLQNLIYPVGFYRNKAKFIKEISRRIISEFEGSVPASLEDLLTLRGVGRKCANLVLGLGFGIPAICVDTHVYRITNRLGWVKTKTPEQTEGALKRIIPRKYWIDLNTILVTFGQNICVPVSPYCNRCLARKSCRRVGVNSSR